MKLAPTYFPPMLLAYISYGVSFEASIMTNLVGSLVDLLGIERGANADGDARAEENVVGDGGNTTVVDLGLFSLVD